MLPAELIKGTALRNMGNAICALAGSVIVPAVAAVTVVNDCNEIEPSPDSDMGAAGKMADGPKVPASRDTAPRALSVKGAAAMTTPL